MVKLDPQSSADVKPFGLRPSNSSRRPSEPVDAAGFDKNASYYDMSGHKYLIILNHHWFERNKHFKKRPSLRNGTYQDERCLRQVFHELGFAIFVLRNLKYKDILDRLKAIVASLDHTRTSCVCVTILTHGEKGGQICAVDRRYQLSEVMDIFGKEPKLTNKPKLYFVQACRGGNMDAGHTVNLGTQSDSQLKKRPTLYHSQMMMQYSGSEESVMLMMHSPPPTARQGDGNFFRGLFDLFMGCGGLSKGPGEIDLLDSQNKSLLTVPSHADTLVVCSTVEDFLSYRDHRGSWMIQALCKSIQKNYHDQNLLDMIIQMHRTVAYDNITNNKKYKEMHKKKQMPETRFILTKHLKFLACPTTPTT